MKPTTTAPTPNELHQLSGTFFYDEQNIVQNIQRIHVMHTLTAHIFNPNYDLPGKHVNASSCWCAPDLAGEDENGIEVWMHNAQC